MISWKWLAPWIAYMLSKSRILLPSPSILKAESSMKLWHLGLPPFGLSATDHVRHALSTVAVGWNAGVPRSGTSAAGQFSVQGVSKCSVCWSCCCHCLPFGKLSVGVCAHFLFWCVCSLYCTVLSTVTSVPIHMWLQLPSALCSSN